MIMTANMFDLHISIENSGKWICVDLIVIYFNLIIVIIVIIGCDIFVILMPMTMFMIMLIFRLTYMIYRVLMVMFIIIFFRGESLWGVEIIRCAMFAVSQLAILYAQFHLFLVFLGFINYLCY